MMSGGIWKAYDRCCERHLSVMKAALDAGFFFVQMDDGNIRALSVSDIPDEVHIAPEMYRRDELHGMIHDAVDDPGSWIEKLYERLGVWD